MSPAPAKPARRPLPLLATLGLSFAIFAAGPFLGEVVRFSRWDDGVANGVFLVILGAIAWVLFYLPASLLIYGVCRWRGWTRFRTLAILTPALCVAAFCAGWLLFSGELAPANRFRQTAGVPLPSTARDVRHWVSGGGWEGANDTFYFRCQPEETDALIRALKLVAVIDQDKAKSYESDFNPKTPAWPDCRAWPGKVFFHRLGTYDSPETSRSSYWLCTDAAHENVYLYTESY